MIVNMGLPMWIIYVNLACFPLLILAVCLHVACGNRLCFA